MKNFVGRSISVLYSYRVAILVVTHVLLIILANQAAFWLRFDGDIPLAQQPLTTSLLPALVAVRLAVFVPLRLHQGVWRYAGIWDLRNIVAAVFLSTALFWILVHGVLGATLYPRSVFIVDAVLLIFFMGGLRLGRRFYAASSPRSGGRPLLVYGAADAGATIVHDMLSNAAFDARPVGFIDDDPRKLGDRIHGVQILGSRHQLAKAIEQTGAEEVLIAIPSASPEALRRIVRELESYKVRITTLPRLSDLVGEVGVGQIRQLKVEDLLARAPISLDGDNVREMLSGKRVLITGAGGSIGSELCRQIAAAQPEAMLMLDRYENSLFAIQNEIKDSPAAVTTYCVIADITDQRRVEQVLDRYQPHVIFHAAAHKHVPLMEENVCEAIKNNVRGTRIVAEAALRAGVERFVLISTDKAVNPTSVMGAAKRVAELLVKSLDRSGSTRFMVVRFGNVLGSNGSVVPRFVSQIAAGGPVTVTHPEMRRYFMLIPEAVQLVLHAAAINDRGSIFVLDMGQQVKVADLARDIIRLSGYVPDQEIEITFVGLRPGEKLFEELVGQGEHVEPSIVPKIMQVRGSATDTSATDLAEAIDRLDRFAAEGHDRLVIGELCRLIPTFQPISRGEHHSSRDKDVAGTENALTTLAGVLDRGSANG